MVAHNGKCSKHTARGTLKGSRYLHTLFQVFTASEGANHTNNKALQPEFPDATVLQWSSRMGGRHE